MKYHIKYQPMGGEWYWMIYHKPFLGKAVFFERWNTEESAFTRMRELDSKSREIWVCYPMCRAELWGEMATEEKMVDAIVKDISGRCGLGNAWEEIDEDIQEEIMRTWAEAAANVLFEAQEAEESEVEGDEKE